MKKKYIIASIVEHLNIILDHLELTRFMPRGLINHIAKHFTKLNNFVLSEIMVTLRIISTELTENNWSK